MGKLILLIFLVGCGKPLLPDKIKIDAPEQVEVTHKVELEWQFINEYCDTYATTNEELEDCLARMSRILTGRLF